MNICSFYITRHKKYLDNRISALSDYVSSHNLFMDDTLEEIVDFLTLRLPHNKKNNYKISSVMDSLLELKTLIDRWDILNDGDIVGYIYQEIQSKADRKQKGQYFTPPDIVTYITNTAVKHINSDNFKVLDPSCGSGQFLISIFKSISKKYFPLSGNRNSNLKKFIKENIFGFDLDPIAVKIARFNLSKISGCDDSEINIFTADYLFKDDLGFIQAEKTIPDFDLIIGNPPWRSKFSIEEKGYFKNNYLSPYSGLNTFTLFIERSYEFLKDKGLLAFQIPEAYLNIKAHQTSRSFVLQNFSIKNISQWGERFKGVFAPSISLILKREEEKSCREKNIINIQQNQNFKDNTAILIPQSAYNNTHENIFNINYSKKAVNLISAIENQHCLYLKNNARFFLGIVTGNNSKFILKEKTDSMPDPIIIGKDLTQYRINFSDHYFKYCNKDLQQVAPKNIYLTKNKILYKFIGKKLTFAIDYNGLYSLNNVNGFISNIESINIESLVAALNSRVMQFYYEKNFFTVKVLKGNLESLPIKVFNHDIQEKLKKLSRLISETKNGNNKMRENIEDIIFHEYGIKDKEAYIISDKISA